MAKCNWCGRNVKELDIVTDSLGEVSNICPSCKKSHDAHECIRCGNVSDLLFKGKCMNCVQVDNYKKQIRQDEVALGISSMEDFEEDSAKVDDKMAQRSNYCAEFDFSDEEYDNWMTMGKTVSPKDIKGDPQLRRIWLIVKLNAAGLPLSAINNYTEDLEKLLDACFMKLINRKCRIIIANSSENRKLIKSSKVIDYRNDVFIVEA